MDENEPAKDSSLAAYSAVLAGAMGGLILASHATLDLEWPTMPHKAAAIVGAAGLGIALGLGAWRWVASRSG
jgi:formate/nitrite transporter FocA (FNT family)